MKLKIDSYLSVSIENKPSSFKNTTEVSFQSNIMWSVSYLSCGVLHIQLNRYLSDRYLLKEFESE